MKKLVAIVVVWALILGGGAAAYKLLFPDGGAAPSGKDQVNTDKPRTDDPRRDNPRRDDPPRKDPATDGGGDKEPKTKIPLALDSFPGYCILRSDELKKKLAARGIGLDLKPDEANYPERLKKVQSGETPLAVFTLDALINATPHKGAPPATIVLLIDETRGADALIVYKDAVRNLDALNKPEAKITLVLNSPSEMLVRLMRSEFNLSKLTAGRSNYLVGADSPDEAYGKFQSASGKIEPQAFVLWEPFVSLALKDPNARVLIDSSDFQGMIVDCLVVQTEYLQKHEDDVREVVKAYLDVLHDVQKESGGMERLIKSDAVKINEKKVGENATALVRGIAWKNARENYAHFELLKGLEAKGLPTVLEMVQKIHAVLVETQKDPSADLGPDRLDRLIDNGILQALYEGRVHKDDEDIPNPPRLRELSEAEWNGLQRVGLVQAKSINFTKNGEMDGDYQTALAEVAVRLKRCPQYYLRFECDWIDNKEDADLRRVNREKARSRAAKVTEYLSKELKIPPERLLAVPFEEPKGTREVMFVFLEARKPGRGG